ncbi:protein kinase [Streptomyces capparidis]
MAPTRGSGPDPAAGGDNQPDAPEGWGNGGTVGDGRYLLTRRLGRGGMAEVFAADDVRLGRTVAVKLLRSDLAADPVAKARFTREAQAVAGLNHHAVVAVYDSGEDQVPGGDSVPFIVMELVEGRTIRDLLLGGEAPPVERALEIIAGVLEALAYSHQRGIVHRDIKPANVIITTTGAVKVMDFGIARALHGASTTMTQTGMVMGTPQYLSPEQALGRAVDARSDLYATGCMLYELLALRPPFTGETPLSVVYQHVQDDPRVPSEISDRVPPELDGLVLRALAKEPDDRYQSAEEMRGEIDYALRMLGTEGAGSGTWATGHFGPTPAHGTPRQSGDTQPLAATPARGTPNQAPYLIGPPVPGQRGRREGRGLRKAVLLAAAAVLAVSVGVIAAASGALSDGGDKTPTETRTTKPSSSAGKEPESEQPRDPGQSSSPQQSGGGTWQQPGTSGGVSRSPDPSYSHSPPPQNGTTDGGTDASPDPSVSESGGGSSEPPGDDVGGSDSEGQEGGTTEGDDSGGSTNEGQGTVEGSAGDGGTDAGQGNAQGTGTTP